MVPNLGIFIFSRNFAIRPSRGCWVQIWQYNFQLPVQKHPNQAFLVTNVRIFIFAPNFATRQIRGRWFEIWQQYFQIPVPKYGNLTKNFYFYTKHCNKANWRVLISNMTMVFQNCCSKHLNKAPFVSKFKNRNFCTKICN